MRYFITGASGQLGYDIVRELERRGEKDYLAPTSSEMDITDKEAVFQIIEAYHPDVIFHCAAWTAVDKAEEEKETAEKVNVLGTRNIVEASLLVSAKLIYISTDYVFDGTKDTPYLEEDETNPKSVYGKTKYLGEKETLKNPKHFIARISWVFGKNGSNFVKTMLRLGETHDTLNVVDDQVGSPTYTVDLAKCLVDMAETEKYGTYHITNEGFCSWAEFAETIFALAGKEVKVNKVTTEAYLELTKTKQAYRPRNSRLSKEKLEANGFLRLPSYQDALKRYLKELEIEVK